MLGVKLTFDLLSVYILSRGRGGLGGRRGYGGSCHLIVSISCQSATLSFSVPYLFFLSASSLIAENDPKCYLDCIRNYYMRTHVLSTCSQLLTLWNAITTTIPPPPPLENTDINIHTPRNLQNLRKNFLLFFTGKQLSSQWIQVSNVICKMPKSVLCSVSPDGQRAARGNKRTEGVHWLNCWPVGEKKR